MAVGINPYALAQSYLGLQEAQKKTRQSIGTTSVATNIHKGEMTKEFEEELAAAQAAAEAELRKKNEKSDRSKFLGGLSTLAGFIPGWGPILSSVLGAYTAGDTMRGAGKHAERQAKLARAQALGVSGKWKNTFLGGKARDYEASAKSYYDELVDKAGVSKSDILKSGVTSGLTSYATGKVISKGMEGLKGLKELTATTEGIPEGISGEDMEKLLKEVPSLEAPVSVETIVDNVPVSSSLKGPTRVSQLKAKYPKITASMDDKYLSKLIQEGIPESLGGYDLSKLLDAKTPRLNALFQSLGLGTQEVGETIGKDSDAWKGLMLLLSQAQSLTE